LVALANLFSLELDQKEMTFCFLHNNAISILISGFPFNFFYK
jgi:hypothetical protein